MGKILFFIEKEVLINLFNWLKISFCSFENTFELKKMTGKIR